MLRKAIILLFFLPLCLLAAAQVGAITITTSAGAVQASGNINGSTTLKVVLGKQGKSIS